METVENRAGRLWARVWAAEVFRRGLLRKNTRLLKTRVPNKGGAKPAFVVENLVESVENAPNRAKPAFRRRAPPAAPRALLAKKQRRDNKKRTPGKGCANCGKRGMPKTA